MNDSFGPIKKTRVSENLAYEIKQKIINGSLKAGDKLPSERDLAKQCETSRVTVREAFRLLESDGLLTIKQGADGGAFIREIDLKTVENSLNVFFQYSDISLSNLTETRAIVEPQIARLAAQNRTEANINEMEKIINHCSHSLDMKQIDLEALFQFHFILAKASQNPLLTAISNSLIRFLGGKLASSNMEDAGHFYQKDQEFHQQIFSAVKNKQPEKAREVMQNHIEVFNKIMLKRYG